MIVTHHHNKSNQQGFALIATISVMVLLVMISLAMLQLSTITIRSSSQAAAQMEARANARLALMLAIGDLQKHAGQDQRVTATAEILDSKPATPAMDDVNQPYWTGVWKTGAAPLDVGATPQRKISLGATSPTISDKASSGHWLVSNPNPSGSTQLNPSTYAGATTGTTQQAVVVAKAQGAVPTDVSVPLVNIYGSSATNPVGRYGYWVADEGVKAKLNLVDPTFGAADTTTTGQAHFLAPQANAIHKIDGLVADPGKDFRSENTAAELDTTITTGTIGLLPTSPADLELNRFMPDVTAYSRGVLANVKNGGLKKDLTAAFETPGGFDSLTANHGYGKKAVYRNFQDFTVPYSSVFGAEAPYYEGITDSLPWATLYAYYNIYKSSMAVPSGYATDATTTPATTGSLSQLPLTVTPRVVSLTNGSQNGKYGGLVPEVIAHRTDIALESYKSGNQWKLRLRYLPQLVLHNPYNCRIETANFVFQRRYYSFYHKITVKVGGVQVAKDILLNQTTAGAKRYPLRNKAGECDVLEPGETRVFGMEADVQKPNLQSAINFAALTSGPNLTMDFGQWADLTTTTGGPAYAGTVDPDAMVEVSISPNNSIATGAADTFISPPNKWPNRHGSRMFLTDGPKVTFPRGTWAKIPIGSLTNPRIVIGFFIRKKGLNPSNSIKTYTNGSTSVPLFHGNAPYFTPFDNVQGVAWEEFYVSPFGVPYTSESEVQTIRQGTSGPWETTFGDGSVGAPGAGTSRHVIRDVPNQPLVSIGQFMHMPTLVFSVSNNFPFGFRDTGSMFIGGSLANPFVSTGANLQENINGSIWWKNLIYDDSFLANDTLFDRFFLSTVPPASLDANAPQQWKDFNNANPESSAKLSSPPLPNSRIKPLGKNGTEPLLSDLRDFDKAAANLMLDGAFNVNSTSVNAWRAMLSSLSGNDMRVFKSETGQAGSISAADLKNPIPRFWSASTSGNVNETWDGNRALSDSEITDLATRIVEQVKLRGPFLSMADFLNRRLGTAGPLTLAGCLQAAIDHTSINSAVKSSGTLVNATGSGMRLTSSVSAPPVIAENLKDGAGNPLNSTVGMPGYLMQQDIVQAFSPAMTVRSDTFVIRAYGESLNPQTGASRSKAWIEAVVQRVPEFVQNADDPNPETELASLTSLINQTLGRHFKVVGFRWLSPNEL